MPSTRVAAIPQEDPQISPSPFSPKRPLPTTTLLPPPPPLPRRRGSWAIARRERRRREYKDSGGGGGRVCPLGGAGI